MTLHNAARINNLQLCKELVSQGIDVNQFNNNMFTPLLIATIKSNIEIVKFLITTGADVNLFYHEPAIALAAEIGNLEMVKFFHQHGAKTNLGPYSLSWIASQNGHSQVLEFLLSLGDNANTIYKEISPLYVAIYNGHLDCVKI